MVMTSQLHQETTLKNVQSAAYVIKNHPSLQQQKSTTQSDKNNSVLILVIDDDFIMRKLLKTYLNGLGYQTATANNGEAGLSLAKQLHPHAILLDVMMPGMDGWSVLSAIKKDPELATIPIIMVSIVEDKNIGELLGAAEYLIKPVRRNDLNTILQKHLGTLEKARVLLVEDDIVMQKLMVEMLTETGWQVQTADNGLQAIEYLTLTHQLPQLILSDLIMPEMDGFELVAALRQSPVWQKIPIVILTSKHLTEDEQTLLNTQAANKIFQKNDYRIEELINEIQQCLTNISKSK